jgi:hypothetical protein
MENGNSNEILAIGEADNVRDAVQESFQAFACRFFPNFALTIQQLL